MHALGAPSADGDTAEAAAVTAIADARTVVVHTLQDLCERADVPEALRKTALTLLGEIVPRDVPETTWVLVRAVATLVQPIWPDAQVEIAGSATNHPVALVSSSERNGTLALAALLMRAGGRRRCCYDRCVRRYATAAAGH